MNIEQTSLLSRRGTQSVLAAVAVAALMVMGIADASAQRGGGGRGGGGRMAQSSISGAGGGRAASRPSGGNMSGNRANTGNINSGNRVNNGNVNIGNDVNIDIDGGYGHRPGYGHGYHHPIAAGIVIGAVAVTTAAVIGSYYRTLPPSCTVVVRAGVSYHYCGSVYYQQTWSGNDVVYVVVNP